MSVATRLEQIQSYMSGLKYNHTGTQFFEIKKARFVSASLRLYFTLYYIGCMCMDIHSYESYQVCAVNDVGNIHFSIFIYHLLLIRPISGLMECAKDMIKEALPIKCLEALVLGVYLTNDIHGLVRFNISFKVKHLIII